MDLTGKRVLITGAGRGIGAAIARRLAADGARIIASARSRDQLEALVNELPPCDGGHVVAPADLCAPADVQCLAQVVKDQVGGLDVLVNNAGVAWGKPFEDITYEDWRNLMAVNLDAVFLLTQACLPMLRAAGNARIVNIGSDASIRGIGRMACYCASKFALRGMTMALRHELKGTGIRLSLIMPGPVNTTIVSDQNRPDLPQPEDVAEIVQQAVMLPDRADVWEILLEPGE